MSDFTMYPVTYFNSNQTSQPSKTQDVRDRQSKESNGTYASKIRSESGKPAPLKPVSLAPTSPGYNVAPPLHSPGQNLGPPVPSPGYVVTQPPPTPTYSMPPPFQQTKYKSGRTSPSQQFISSVHKYSVSPTSGNNSPKLLYPPPRSPNIVYQPSSPSLSYFSSHSGTRQRTLIEVPRVDSAQVPGHTLSRMPDADSQGIDSHVRLEKDCDSSVQINQLNVPETRLSAKSTSLSGQMTNGMTAMGDQVMTQTTHTGPMTNTCLFSGQISSPLAGTMTGGFNFSNQNSCSSSISDHVFNGAALSNPVANLVGGSLPRTNGPGASVPAASVPGASVAGQIIFTGSHHLSKPSVVNQMSSGVAASNQDQAQVTSGLSGGVINITKSRLDPNVRPFTPSGKFYSYLPQYEGCDATESTSYQTCDSETQSQADDFEDGFVFKFDVDQELGQDPLPKDPGTLLPDLDTTLEDVNNNVSYMENNNLTISTNNNNNNHKITNDKNIKSGQTILDEKRLESSAPSPLIDDSMWQANLSRPSFLSTPSSFISLGYFGASESRRDNVEPESRNLVSGLEQSLHKWIANQQLQFMQQQASFIDRIKRRMANGHAQATKELAEQQHSQQSSRKFATGGIFSQELAIPPEYLMSHIIGDRVKPINIRQEHTDLLFFLFYTMHGDAMQLVAASLLFERGWRFHKQQRIWLARWPGVRPEEKTDQFEKGLYQYFDMVSWKRIPGWFRLDYCHLAEKTNVPEDLKSLYTKYSEVMRNVNSTCSKNIALHGFETNGCEEFDQIEGINLMSCVM